MCSPIFTVASATLGTASAIHSFQQEKERREQMGFMREESKEKQRSNLENKKAEYEKERKKEAELMNLRSAKSGLLPYGSVEIARRNLFKKRSSADFMNRQTSPMIMKHNPWKIGNTVLSSWSKMFGN